MIYGQFVSWSVYLTTDGSGLPIREAAEPNPGAGYHTALSYEQHDGAIWQVWTLVPDAGTPQDAALMLAQIQAAEGDTIAIDYLQEGPDAWILKLARV